MCSNWISLALFMDNSKVKEAQVLYILPCPSVLAGLGESNVCFFSQANHVHQFNGMHRDRN